MRYGRLSLPLAQDGHDVVCVDASASMLIAAQQKAKSAGVDVEFILDDMRSFELGRNFDLVIVSCNSMAHLTTNEDLTSALRGIARHLAPGGLFAFDIMNPRIAELAPDNVGRPGVDGTETGSSPAEKLLAYDPIRQIRVLQWEVTVERNKRVRTEPMRLRAIFPQELPMLLAAAGLELADRYGDFAGNPLTGDSFNQVCLAAHAPQDFHPRLSCFSPA